MDLRSGGKFTWEEAEPIIDSICHAVESMRPGEVHGDVKPENVMILPEAVKLTDLGLSRIADPAQFVTAQVVAGNAYMAPELAADAERIVHDPAVDAYALGVLMYQLLTGALPAPGESRPGKRVPTLPGKIDEIVARALAADPDERYAHAAELHLDLARLAGKAETAAKVEIFLSDLPARAKLHKPAPVAPPPAAPPVKSKSLFDESLLGEAEQATKPKAAAAPAPLAAPAAKSKTPLIAGAVGAVIAAAAVIGFLATRPQEPPPAPDSQAAAPAAAKPAEDGKQRARDALARAEKSRDDAIKVDASKNAADVFVAAMIDLRDATDLLRANKFGAAQEKAARAEKAFQEAIIKGVTAQSEKAEQAAKPAEKKPAAAAEGKAAAAPAAKKPPCAEDMVLIPAGSFVMGSASNDPDRNPGEKYNESVAVPGYCIDKYEYPNKKGTPPQVNVTWPQAKSACEAKGRRLCSETEWEKACKGPGNQKFPYGAKFDADKCNTEDAKGDDRALGAAGKFAACMSGYGVADLSGNAWEWTESQLQSNSKDRVLRGGSFTRPDYHDRCANRYNSLPSVADKEFGFRCCADVNP
jgi:formylglycine-generating enzyme required for sulfatase activity